MLGHPLFNLLAVGDGQGTLAGDRDAGGGSGEAGCQGRVASFPTAGQEGGREDVTGTGRVHLALGKGVDVTPATIDVQAGAPRGLRVGDYGEDRGPALQRAGVTSKVVL